MTSPGMFHSILSGEMERFLSHKRAAGRRYRTEESALRLLDRYLVEQHIARVHEITPSLVDAFLTSRPRKRPRSFNHLLGATRLLFSWLVQQGFMPQSPVHTRPRRQTAQRLPFIFDLPVARRLLHVAAELPDNPRTPLRGMTYRTVFALLYGLGLRVGEVTRLCVRDVDFERQLLVIRESKFYKSRLAPFGPMMADLLRCFLQARTRCGTDLTPDSPLFSFHRKRPINPCTISQTFHRLVPRLSINLTAGVSSPRLHDLRHSFAVGTLLRWYRAGINPQDRLLRLSTFLGHVDPMSTAIYLTVNDALLREANSRFESFVQPVLQRRAGS